MKQRVELSIRNVKYYISCIEKLRPLGITRTLDVYYHFHIRE